MEKEAGAGQMVVSQQFFVEHHEDLEKQNLAGFTPFTASDSETQLYLLVMPILLLPQVFLSLSANPLNKQMNEIKQAIDSYKKVMAIYEENQMQTHSEYAKCYMNLGVTYCCKLAYDEAIDSYKKAMAIYEENQMQTHSEYAKCYMNLGVTYCGKLDYDEAIDSFKKVMAIYEENQMQTHPEYAKCYVNLGIAYGDTGKKDDSLRCLELALGIFEQSVGRKDPYYQHCQQILAGYRK